MRVTLFRDAAERERLLDATRRLRGAELAGLGVVAVPSAAAAGLHGLATAALLLCAWTLLAAGLLALDRVGAPARVLLAAAAGAQGLVLVALGVADGSLEYLLPIPLVPIVVVAVAFGRPVVAAMTGASILGLVVVGLGTAGDELTETPPWLFVPCVMFVAMAMLATTARDVDVVVRGTAVDDPLTGVLNRVALKARLAELEAQSVLLPEPTALLLLDLDHFKRVNDTHGHAVGDEVLQSVARTVQRSVGTDGTLYRYGGEEFVAVLPTADLEQAAAVAERLRADVAALPVRGLRITVSCGLGCSAGGSPFVATEVLGAADEALYAAKRAGRNRVRAAGARLRDGDAPRNRRDDRPGGDAPTVVTVDEERHGPEDPEAADAPAGTAWLIRSRVEREQLLDTAVRSRPMHSASAALTVIALLARSPWYGWLPVVPVVVGAAVMDPLQHRARSFRRPEVVMFAALVGTLFTSAVSTVLMQPAALFSLVLYGQLVFPGAVAFWARGAWLLCGWAGVLMLAVALLRDPDAAFGDPGALLLPLTLLVFLCLVGRGLGRSTTDHRVRAIIDPTTGIPNRAALEARLAELEHADATAGGDVSVLVIDIDHFKRVNDEAGHDTGDRVLEQLALRLRRGLRRSDGIYRIGGEEFVVLLPATGLAGATTTAERLRDAVAATPLAGRSVTVSVGVAGPEPGRFDYRRRFAAADAAVYRAKLAGRDRVEVDGREAEPAGVA